LSIVSSEPPGYELPLRLLLGFRVLIDALHAELARHGHPDLRPVHGFVLQAVGTDGTSAVELGQRLGVTKQAAAKHIHTLERLGYLSRRADAGDGRRKLVALTDRGVNCLTRSAEILDALHAEWADRLGADRLRALEEDLRTLTPGHPLRVDVPGWFGTAG
jgi:DNA-binding MarR family transcriptional regulator